MSFRQSGMTWFFFCALGAACVLPAGCADEAPDVLLREARAALKRGEFDEAEGRAALVPQTSPEYAEAALVAGEAATKGGRFPQALEYYQGATRNSTSPENERTARFSAAEILRELGRLTDAEDEYRRVLEISPGNTATHERLAFLLSTTGRRWEALPHYLSLVRSGGASIPELILVADLDRPVEREEYLRECLRKAPEDRHVQLGLAAHAFQDGRAAEAEERLRAVLSRSPGLLSGQAMLGELLVDQNDDRFLEWRAGLPAGYEAHPDLWFVLGLRARRAGRLEQAAGCFRECLQRVPTHRRAMYQLGQVLMALNDSAGRDISERAGLLIELTQVLDTVLRSDQQREAPIRQTAELLERMGRVLEACAWGVAAQRQFPQAAWPRDLFARWSESLRDDLPITLDQFNLLVRHDLSRYPHQEETSGRNGTRGMSADAGPAAVSTPSSIRFTESGNALDFVYLNGGDPGTRGARIFEQTGGGVAVCDFDQDGRPDLFFPQGGTWPTGSNRPVIAADQTDRLFRNSGAAPLDDVSAMALPGDGAFGQGCTSADFNNDGFPDLYVASTGRNQLLQNQGDGTFLDITATAGLESEDWTTSVLVTDLNADGHPDLYDVNYLQGPGVYEAICNGHACAPSVFPGCPDRLLISRGDGTFELIPDATPRQDAKGLGVVTVFREDPRRPALFIANDQVPNFLLKCDDADNPHRIALHEEGLLAGLAFNDDGLAMACMGVAADDANGDGLTDLFVTNFSDESNTLYVQDAQSLFVDTTRSAGLMAASLPFVGWGTQFLDADLDGHSDLVVANGHVDDYRDEGGEYHMRPQFFRNQGNGRFVELTSEQAGPFFARLLLGRGLARLDWNQDGLMDFAVSNMNDRAALVTNSTEGAGHFLNVRLHATSTARDAIGSRAVVTTSTGSMTKVLLAGDGYMACNERLMQFGLGTDERVPEVRVFWPSGAQTTVENLPADVVLELVEGAGFAATWRGGLPADMPRVKVIPPPDADPPGASNR